MTFRLKPYIAVARPSHWIKNLFLLPGVLLALWFVPQDIGGFFPALFFGSVSVCMLASANYVINEWLDAAHDRVHPTKKQRPSVLGEVQRRAIITEYLALVAFGLVLAWWVSKFFFLTGAFFLVMGLVYNLPPLRSKDVPFLDVLSESVNNPLRFLFGWFMVTDAFLPPVSVLAAYWMGGAFLMAAKRLSEWRTLGSETARLYRKSFARYTDETLIASMVCYSFSFAFFGAIFMLKYRIEVLLTLPLFALLFAWYTKRAMEKDSIAEHPERLHRDQRLLLAVTVLFVSTIALFLLDVPRLRWLLETALIRASTSL